MPPPSLLPAIALLHLTVAALVGVTLMDERDQVERQAAVATQNDALILESDLAGTLRAHDLVLQSVVDEYRRHLAAGIDAPRLSQFVAEAVARLPDAEGVRLTDADGVTRYGTPVPPGGRVNLADRPQFRILAEHEQDGLVISRPQRSRLDHQWQLTLARGATDANGSFAGMAYVTVPVEKLTATLSRISIPHDGAVTLRGADLAIIARYPQPDNADDVVGQGTVAKEFTDLLKTDASTGTFVATTPLDGIERMTTFRKVGQYPLYLTVGRAEHEYSRSWRRSATVTAALTTLFIFVTTGLALLLRRTRQHLARANESIGRLAETDFVSGLMNRRALAEAAELEAARARRYAKPISLMILDVDHFKSINDTLGHYVGDRVLHLFASNVRNALREVDLIGRWSGGAFVAVLPETDVIQAREVAERVRQTIATTELALPGAPPMKLTVSIGVATLLSPRETTDTMLARADAALREAKNTGRNRVCG